MTDRQRQRLRDHHASRYWIAYQYIGALCHAGDGVAWYDEAGTYVGTTRSADGYEEGTLNE